MEEDDGKKYTWETEYERSWEVLQEDSEGLLQSSRDEDAYKAKRRRLFQRPTQTRLGMMRYLFVVVDMSRAMEDKDLKPDRINCSVKMLEMFVLEFFDQNPISQVGIILTRNGRAEKVLELNGNSQLHLRALRQLAKDKCGGDPSLQNALEMVIRGLRHVPSHASKEVLVVLGALASCDPGNVFTTIEELVRLSIRCSIVGLAAEVRLCKTVSDRTQGLYSVILDEGHFKDLMIQHCQPPPAKASMEATLIMMGFPTHQINGPLMSCLCHLEERSAEHVTTAGYFCPRCVSKYCELPVECKVCGLTLVQSSHLARSYHHLFPLPLFEETHSQEKSDCCGCQVLVEGKPAWNKIPLAEDLMEVFSKQACAIFQALCVVYVCPECKERFCIDCDLYVHETLYNCPGCSSTSTTLSQHLAAMESDLQTLS